MINGTLNYYENGEKFQLNGYNHWGNNSNMDLFVGRKIVDKDAAVKDWILDFAFVFKDPSYQIQANALSKYFDQGFFVYSQNEKSLSVDW